MKRRNFLKLCLGGIAAAIPFSKILPEMKGIKAPSGNEYLTDKYKWYLPQEYSDKVTWQNTYNQGTVLAPKHLEKLANDILNGKVR